MHIPDSFAARLKSEFDGRLRIRFSNSRREFQVEQKIAPGQQLDMPVSEQDDDLIRARDGYALLMSVTLGDRTSCPLCGSTIRVPIMRFAEAHCDWCRAQGRDGRYALAYYPLEGDSLIEHLRSLDPLRGRTKQRDALLKARNEALIAKRENDFVTKGTDHATDDWRQWAGIPMVGYTGKETV